MKIIKISVLAMLIVLLSTCKKDSIDDQQPEIDMDFSGAFPFNCDTLYIGESNTFKAIFTDNVELGSYSIDIHNNFDHHSHSTDVEECNLEAIKSPVNPFLYINEFEMQNGQKEYQATNEITIPDDVDEGDYHFFISLTDKEGWRAEKGISVKLLKR